MVLEDLSRQQGGRWKAGLCRGSTSCGLEPCACPGGGCTNLPVQAPGCLPACLACAHPASFPAFACHLGCLPWASACSLLHHWGWREPRLEIVAHPSITGQGSFLISLPQTKQVEPFSSLRQWPLACGCLLSVSDGAGWKWEGGPGLAG